MFWAVGLSEAVDRHTVEVFRSGDILARKERDAKTADEAALVSEEKQRLGRHEADLRRALQQADAAASSLDIELTGWDNN